MSAPAFVLVLVVGGTVVGALARLAVPGPDPMPLWATAVLGIAGSALGGGVAYAFAGATGGVPVALAGAVLLLIAYRRFVQGRGITGPEAKRPPTRGPWLPKPRRARRPSLDELVRLRDAGVITPAEFEAMRTELERGGPPP